MPFVPGTRGPGHIRGFTIPPRQPSPGTVDALTTTFAGTSTLSGTVTPYQNVTVTLAGTSSLAATAVELHRFTVTLAGTSTLAGTVVELQRLTVTFAGTSSLSATITELQRITATLAGTSSLTGTISEYQRFTATFAGTSSLTSLIGLIPLPKLVTVTLAGTSSLSGVPSVLRSTATTFAGTSALSGGLTTSNPDTVVAGSGGRRRASGFTPLHPARLPKWWPTQREVAIGPISIGGASSLSAALVTTRDLAADRAAYLDEILVLCEV